MENKLSKDFIAAFNLDKEGFTEVTPFVDGNLGFSIKQKDTEKSNYASLIHIFVSNKALADEKIKPKPIITSATYGKQTQDGISMRREDEFSVYDPIDAEFPNEFFYDPQTKQFYRFGKKIEAIDILKRVYSKHVKTTNPIRGLITRFKIRFWWFFMKDVFNFISKIFYYALLVISGNRYKYEPLMQEVTLNGDVISSAWSRRVTPKVNEPQEKLKEAKKFQFLQYEASFWSIVFYSILHMIFYVTFMLKNYKPKMLTTIFENNFLTLIYVIISLFAVEFLVPKLLMLAIKYSSILSFRSAHKKIDL
jgi:hypothetical protein